MAASAAPSAITALRAAKKELRTRIGAALAALPKDVIASGSQAVREHTNALPVVARSKGVFAFLSMPDEVQTYDLVGDMFAAGRCVYVPKVIGRRSMAVLRAESAASLAGFEKSKWGIPEPPTPTVEPTGESISAPVADAEAFDWTTVRGEAAWAAAGGGGEPVDLVLVPGVAFDRSGKRCGHGRGYYDTFLERICALHESKALPRPWLVALCLSPQMVDDVPTGHYDVPVDFVISPSGVVAASERARAEE